MSHGTSFQLSGTLIDKLAVRGDLKSFDRGELLLSEGDVSDALYILIAGQLKVFTRDHKGRELVYNILRPGEFFGELFLDGGPRSASVKAMCASQCVVVDQATIRDFMSTYPEFAECLALKLIERLRHATQQIKSLVLNGVYERTVLLLNQLATNESGATSVPITITQQEMADRVGATREMINHIIRDLVRGGFLNRRGDRKMMIIKDLPKHW